MVRKISRSLAGVVLVASGLAVFAVLIVPRLLGWDAYVVTSGSMEPTFGPGSVVVVAAVSPEDIRARDIVTFRDPDGFTTHRVLRVTASSSGGEDSTALITQGDANADADPQPLDPRNVVGKARFAVPHLGFFVELIKSPLGAGAFAALFLFVAFSGRAREDDRATVAENEQREAVAVS
jgi:signal peptidase